MKFLLLVHFTGLALLGTTVLCEEKSGTTLKESVKHSAQLEQVALKPQENEQESLETVPENEEEKQALLETVYEPKSYHVVDVPEEENINLGQILGDFFGGDDNEQEENFNREGRAKGVKNGELKFTNDPEIISQYNGFIDAFLRQLASTMSENSDPLPIILRKNYKISGSPKNKRKGPSSLDGDDEVFPNEGPKRPNHPKGGKGNNSNRRKTKIRHPKNLSTNDTFEGGEIEEEVLNRQKRETVVENAEESKVKNDEIEEVEEVDEADIPNDEEASREGRVFEEDYDDMEEDEKAEEDSALAEEDENTLTEVNGKALSDAEVDEGRSDGNDVESRQTRRRRRKGGRRGKRRKGKCGKKCQRRRRRRIRIRNRQRINRKRGKRSVGSEAILTGLSLIRRDGDVKVVQKKDAQDIHANIEVGPVTLTAEKTFGEGENSQQRKSDAVTPAVKGKIVINVSKDGNATVRNLIIFRPKDISVSGSLRLDQATNNSLVMHTYLSQASPFVSKRLKAAADRVFGVAPANANKKKNNNRKGPGNNKVKKNVPRN